MPFKCCSDDVLWVARAGSGALASSSNASGASSPVKDLRPPILAGVGS